MKSVWTAIWMRWQPNLYKSTKPTSMTRSGGSQETDTWNLDQCHARMATTKRKINQNRTSQTACYLLWAGAKYLTLCRISCLHCRPTTSYKQGNSHSQTTRATKGKKEKDGTIRNFQKKRHTNRNLRILSSYRKSWRNRRNFGTVLLCRTSPKARKGRRSWSRLCNCR